MICKKCGAVISSDDIFCTQCGTKIDKENTSETTADTDSREDFTSQPDNAGSIESIFSNFRLWLSLLATLMIPIGVLWLGHSDAGHEILADAMAYLTKGDPYINLVKTARVELFDTTYETIVNQTFYDCNWSYFKKDGDRIVELNCRERSYGYAVRMQFMVTPVGDDMYYIETCYLSVDGVMIKDILSWLYSQLYMGF